MTDLASLHKTIQLLLTQNPSLSLGTASTVYVSLPDTSSTCANLGLPSLPSGYTYSCVPQASSTLINSSGWLPIDFTSAIQSMAKLPIDPSNTSSTSLYYTYTPNPITQTYELTSILESIKYRLGGSSDKVSSDGGDTSYTYEKGTNLSLSPLTDTGLVGYWKFDEGTGTQAMDSSGNGNTGTLINSPTWQDPSNCKVGRCLLFGSNNKSVITNATNLFDIDNKDFSISGWFYVPTGIDANWTGILIGTTYTSGYQLAEGRFFSGSGTPLYLNFVNNIPRNTWYHLVGVHDSNTKTGYIYINGLLITSGSYSGSLPISNHVVAIHRESGYAYNDVMDDIRIYNRVLSRSEITALYNATR